MVNACWAWTALSGFALAFMLAEWAGLLRGPMKSTAGTMLFVVGAYFVVAAGVASAYRAWAIDAGPDARRALALAAFTCTSPVWALVALSLA